MKNHYNNRSLNKPFNQSLFRDNDEKGRKVVIKYCALSNIHAVDHPNIYAVDLILYKENQKVAYAEVEVRNSWNTDIFPFQTLNVPSRKKKLLQNDLPTYFFSINCISTRMFMTTDQVILSSKLAIVENKYIQDDEWFYKVNLDQCLLIYI